MKFSGFRVFTAIFLAVLSFTFTPAFAAAPSVEEPVVLVAKRGLPGVYAGTVLLAVPGKGGIHLGLILNRPTVKTLGESFPEHAPSKLVNDPLFFGGPTDMSMVFTLVKSSEPPSDAAIPMMDGIFLVMDTPTVDSIIEKNPAARFYIGIVVWKPGELARELKKGAWGTLEADPDLLFRKSTEKMWEELDALANGTWI